MKCPRCGGRGFVNNSCVLCGHFVCEELKTVMPITQDMLLEGETEWKGEVIPKALSTRRELSAEEKAQLRAYKKSWFEKKKQDPAWYEAFKEKNRARHKKSYDRKKQAGVMEGV